MRQRQLKIRHARGFLLIAAVFVLVLVAIAVVALGNMTSADIRSSSGHAQSEQAYFVATSGSEYASQQFGAGTQCANLANTNIAVGAGTFSTSGVLYYPPVRTTLTAAIGAGDTTIPVASIAGYAPRGQVRIDNEYINYASTSSVAGTCSPAAAPCLVNAQRGVSGSTAAGHVITTPVAQAMCVVTSTGTVGNAKRVLQQGMRLPGAMFVYAQANGNRVPYYRIWDGTAWGAEQMASNIGGAGNIEYMVLKFARTRNEAILGIQDSAGAISVQTWNGAVWSAVTAVGTALPGYRGFDIAYEQNSDRALIAYYNGVGNQFSYRTWDGASISGPTAQALPAVGVTPIRWLQLASNPLATSNEVAMITTDSSGAGAANIYGLRWSGSAWDNMGVATLWDTAAANTATNIIDVAYEQQSGDILFLWGGAVRVARYRSYSAGSLDAVNSTLTIPEYAGTPNWVRLAPDPKSNRIMYAGTDTSSDFNTRVWSGTAWDCNGGVSGACAAHPEHDASVENITGRVFDIVWETYPTNAGIAWLVWGGSNLIRTRRYNNATPGWAAAGTLGTDHDTDYVHLLAHPYPDSGVVLAGIYLDTAATVLKDVLSMQLTGGGSIWSALGTIWGGPTVALPVRSRMYLDAERSAVMIYSAEVYP